MASIYTKEVHKEKWIKEKISNFLGIKYLIWYEKQKKTWKRNIIKRNTKIKISVKIQGNLFDLTNYFLMKFQISDMKLVELAKLDKVFLCHLGDAVPESWQILFCRLSLATSTRETLKLKTWGLKRILLREYKTFYIYVPLFFYSFSLYIYFLPDSLSREHSLL